MVFVAGKLRNGPSFQWHFEEDFLSKRNTRYHVLFIHPKNAWFKRFHHLISWCTVLEGMYRDLCINIHVALIWWWYMPLFTYRNASRTLKNPTKVMDGGANRKAFHQLT